MPTASVLVLLAIAAGPDLLVMLPPTQQNAVMHLWLLANVFYLVRTKT
jgi:hypothetical protein